MAFSHGVAGKSRKRYGIAGHLLGSHGLTATTAGTSEEVLATYTLVKGALDTNGQGLRILAWATTAGNANNKALAIRINGLTGILVAANAAAAINGGNIRLEAIVRRASATTINSIGMSIAAAVPALTNVGGSTVANFDTADQTIVVTGTTASQAGDLTLRGFQIEVLPETPSPSAV